MTSGYRPKVIQSEFVDFIGSRLNPFWSLTVPKLRLLARKALSDDLIALKFEVNSAFKRQAFRAKQGWYGGQHLNLKVLINGIYHQRSYSLVGMPHQTLWWGSDNNNDKKNSNANRNSNAKLSQQHTLTIALKPQGLVSNYLTKLAPIGTIFDTSLPSGDFILDRQTKNPPADHSNLRPSLLFIASGSGITPMLGLVTQALKEGRQVTLLHYNRLPVLAAYWSDLATQYPAFNYHLIDTQDPDTYWAGSRYLTTQSLLALDLSLEHTQIFACGAQALITSLYQAANEITLPNDYLLRDNITIESFGTAASAVNTQEGIENENNETTIEAHNVYLRMRQQRFSSDTTILVAAEQAGMRLPYGCRQGICQMCRCNKVSGVVKNIQTGKVSGSGFESIQTCINVAMSEVVLDV